MSNYEQLQYLIIQILLEYKANPYITSFVTQYEEETVLEAACRWSHVAIIRFYLTKTEWNIETLYRALSKCRNETVKKEIVEKINKELKEYSCVFLGCYCGKKQPKISPNTMEASILQ